jgi:hypothetical protein
MAPFETGLLNSPSFNGPLPPSARNASVYLWSQCRANRKVREDIGGGNDTVFGEFDFNNAEDFATAKMAMMRTS